MKWCMFGLLVFAWFIASDAKVEFYLGGSVGFNPLVDAPSMRRLLDTGRVSVYITQDVALDINQSLSTIANLWTSADPGQTAFTFGVDNNTIGSYASMFHHSSWFPNVVSIDGPWQSNNYADLNRTNWSAYVNTIRTTGMSIVMPIYVLTPAENANNSLLNIYSWTHNPYWNFLRSAALYGGGLAIQLCSWNSAPSAYAEFVYNLVDWCTQHNIRSSVIIPVGSDQTDPMSSVKWLNDFSLHNLPTQFVFDCSYTTASIGPETVNGTCANITFTATQMFPTLANIQQCEVMADSGLGTGLTGTYYNGEAFDTLVGTRLDPQINFIWPDSPFTGVNPDHFSVKWTGYILPKYTGKHYFTVTVDDGIRLTVDGQLIIDHWLETDVQEERGTIYLSTGVLYPITIEFMEYTIDAVISLSWATFCQPFTVVPSSQLFPSNTGITIPQQTGLNTGTGTGLRADFYVGAGITVGNWAGWQGNQTVFVDWDSGRPSGPFIPTSFPSDLFSVVWTGQILPQYTGEYMFYISADDGIRFYINDLLIVDSWIGTRVLERTTSANLVSGVKYNIRIEFVEFTGEATIYMYWSCGLSVPKQPVPLSQLFYRFPQPIFEPDMTDNNFTESKTRSKFSLKGNGISCAPQQGGNRVVCGACSFPGNSTLSLPSNISLLPTRRAPRTICAWGKSRTTITTASRPSYMVSYGLPGINSAYYFGSIYGSAGGGSNTRNLTSIVPWSNPYWNHVCLAYDGTQASLYLNASLVSSQSANWSTPVSPVTLGGNGNTEFWNGLIYDVLGWNQTLTAEEIKTVFNYPKCASYIACDGDQFSSSLPDLCGVCFGNGKSCLGCDGVAYSGKKLDKCGVCGGDGSSCFTLPPSPCGDGKCNAAIGETCDTCLKDCKSTCGSREYCGDLKCNAKETCTTCSTDCGKCAVPACPKNSTGSTCSSRGSCASGACNCNAPWSGPACDITSVPIKTTINPQAPSTSLNPSSNSANGTYSSFMIAISRIEERDKSGKVVQTVDVSTLKLNLSSLATVNGSQYTYSTTLSNGALLKILIYIYNRATTVVFAGQRTTIAQNAIKFNLGLALWPFKTASNTVNYILQSNSTKGDVVAGDSCNVQKSEDADGNLLWFSVAFNGLSLYGKFLPNALVDNVPKPFAQKWVGNGDVMLSLPFFWREAWIDPDFSVLLDVQNNSECSKKHKKVPVGLIVGLGVGIVGVALLVSLIYMGWKSRRISILKKYLHRERVDSSSNSGH